MLRVKWALVRGIWCLSVGAAAVWFVEYDYPHSCYSTSCNCLLGDLQNCTIKPPAPILLRHRHRRLCPTCVRAPLPSLVSPHLSNDANPSAVKSIVKQSVCACPLDGVWLCQPCGRGLRSADTTYESIWRWRSSYGDVLGSVGTGIGDGDRSFECGRAAECLAARQVQEEIDCDAEDARENDAAVVAAEGQPNGHGGGLSNGNAAVGAGLAHTTGESGVHTPHTSPGYTRHEIEGIGGVVKKKLVRMIWVGACVTEWEDERDQGRYLVREVEGRTRSWCGWCWRVIPGAKDNVE